MSHARKLVPTICATVVLLSSLAMPSTTLAAGGSGGATVGGDWVQVAQDTPNAGPPTPLGKSAPSAPCYEGNYTFWNAYNIYQEDRQIFIQSLARLARYFNPSAWNLPVTRYQIDAGSLTPNSSSFYWQNAAPDLMGLVLLSIDPSGQKFEVNQTWQQHLLTFNRNDVITSLSPGTIIGDSTWSDFTGGDYLSWTFQAQAYQSSEVTARSTLAADASSGATTLQLTSTAGFKVGGTFNGIPITGVGGSSITLARGISWPLSAGSTIAQVSQVTRYRMPTPAQVQAAMSSRVRQPIYNWLATYIPSFREVANGGRGIGSVTFTTLSGQTSSYMQRTSPYLPGYPSSVTFGGGPTYTVTLYYPGHRRSAVFSSMLAVETTFLNIESAAVKTKWTDPPVYGKKGVYYLLAAATSAVGTNACDNNDVQINGMYFGYYATRQYTGCSQNLANVNTADEWKSQIGTLPELADCVIARQEFRVSPPPIATSTFQKIMLFMRNVHFTSAPDAIVNTDVTINVDTSQSPVPGGSNGSDKDPNPDIGQVYANVTQLGVTITVGSQVLKTMRYTGNEADYDTTLNFPVTSLAAALDPSSPWHDGVVWIVNPKTGNYEPAFHVVFHTWYASAFASTTGNPSDDIPWRYTFDCNNANIPGCPGQTTSPENLWLDRTAPWNNAFGTTVAPRPSRLTVDQMTQPDYPRPTSLHAAQPWVDHLFDNNTNPIWDAYPEGGSPFSLDIVVQQVQSNF